MFDQTIKQIHNSKTGKISDKWSSYLDTYDELFLKFKNKEINLLEIGVQNGGSLETWASYFKNANFVVGCDIDPKCKQLTYNDPRIKLIVNNINNKETYQVISNNCNSLDIIIDDGSHISTDILESFVTYFPLLNPGGVYVIEDTHTLYWKEWNDEINMKFNAYIFFKKIIDVINIQFWEKEKSLDSYFSDFFVNGNIPSFINEGWIESVEFKNSLIIIKKSLSPNRYGLGQRLVTGSIGLVNDNVIKHHQG